MTPHGQVSIADLGVGYGSAEVLSVDRIDIKPGEFISILGPSGCGKTTLLNTIAGFLNPVRGQILIDNVDVTRLPARKRNLGLVFQDYALFPHLTIGQNLEYGLKIRKKTKSERQAIVEQSLEIVGLSGFTERRPQQLSGGQKQRVALARALAIEPNLLLLDEPLSSLDAKLRRAMRQELREIQKRVGTTMIFVTHDQDEALTMSDRVAIFANGRLEQIGTPEELYRRPATEFVADFLGAANILKGSVIDSENIEVDGILLPVRHNSDPGSQVSIALRSETINLFAVKPGGKSVQGRIVYKGFGGEQWRVTVLIGDTVTLNISVPDSVLTERPIPGLGAVVWLSWPEFGPIQLER